MRAASVKAGAAFMLMTFERLKRMLSESVMRSDLKHNYGEWVNRGLRRIQTDRNWACMKRMPVVSIASGDSSVQLPSDFKELTTEQYPISVSTAGDSGRFPCDLISEEISIARKATTFWQPAVGSVKARRAGLPVYLTTNGEDVFLHVAEVASEDLDFHVSAYLFLPELQAEDDANELTRKYPELVTAAIKAIAFFEVNDFEMSTQFGSAYASLLDAADTTDQRKLRAGRPIRMGG